VHYVRVTGSFEEFSVNIFKMELNRRGKCSFYKCRWSLRTAEGGRGATAEKVDMSGDPSLP